MIECTECGTLFQIVSDSYECPTCGAESFPDDEDCQLFTEVARRAELSMQRDTEISR